MVEADGAALGRQDVGLQILAQPDTGAREEWRQDEQPDVAQQAGGEEFLGAVRPGPSLHADRAGHRRGGDGVAPQPATAHAIGFEIDEQDVRGRGGQDHAAQAGEADDRDRFADRSDRLRSPVEGAVDQLQHLAGQDHVLFDQLLQIGGRTMGITDALQHLADDMRQRRGAINGVEDLRLGDLGQAAGTPVLAAGPVIVGGLRSAEAGEDVRRHVTRKIASDCP